jgi:signal transduction histidine kinase
MRPSILDESGLELALKRFTAEFSQRLALPLEFVW